jgi:endoglucanase
VKSLASSKIVETVSDLCELPGPSGYEQAVRDWIIDRWRSGTSKLAVDPVGNVIARVGSGTGPRVLIDAHMDEIGYKVRFVTEDGFLMLADAQRSNRGPQERRYMIGHPAQVVTRDGVVARGVFAAPSGHVLSPQFRAEGHHLMLSDFFVDLGLSHREEVEALGVHVGAAVIFDVQARPVGSRLVAKAMDDRLMLAIMTLLVETLDPRDLTVDLCLSATVQEENGLHGAKVLAATERFDAVIAMDVGLTGDIPVIARDELQTVLGGGPIIVHSDDGITYDADLTWQLLDAARSAGVSYQHGTFSGYASNGRVFQDAGMPTALVAPPVRYTHTAIEMADLDDIAASVRLLEAYVTGSGPGGTRDKNRHVRRLAAADAPPTDAAGST